MSDLKQMKCRVVIAVLAGFASSLAWSQEEMLEPVEVKAEESVATASETADAAAVETTGAGKKESSAEAKDSQSDELEEELKRLRRERDLISVRNAIRSEQIKEEMAVMREEKERLALENSLFMERVKADLIEQRGEIDRISAEVDAINNTIALESAKMRRNLQTELADLKMEEERLQVEISLMLKKTGVELERLRLAEAELKVRRTELETQLAELQAKLALKEKQDEVRDQVLAEHEPYMLEPYVDGVLHISDRRIALNGPIWSGLSSYVSERINFFNNQSAEYPIFIVIDSSPGGSVWAGYRILKAMESSEAPVCVVVKSYAASMAAIITTLAEKSYAFPNALILHHELSWYGVAGNLSQQSEYAEDAKEWWRRLARPVAEKMGVTLEEFKALMYQQSAVGDWQEFGDVAQEYKWVDVVVDQIRETSIDKNPDRYGQQMWAMEEAEVLRDEKGRAYVELPRLEPFDFYFLYDPDNYYRIPR